jgi:capsular exopolysaccharide synthesis family protein
MDEVSESVIDLRDVVSILRRRYRLIVLTGAIVLGLAFLYLAQTTPLYTSTTLILVDPAQKNLLAPEREGMVNSSLASSLIESEVEILRSNTVLLAVIEAADLLRDPEFGPSLSLFGKFKQAVGIAPRGSAADGAALLNNTLNKLNNAVSARRRGMTNLIALSVTAEDPERAATLANTLAATYIRLQVQAKSQSFMDARDVLEAQLSAAQRALGGSDAALANYIDENLARLERESGSDAVAALRARLERANASGLAAKVTADDAATALAARDWSALADRLGDQALASLEGQRAALASRLGQTAEGSDAAVNLRAGLEQIEAQLARQGEAAVASLRDEVSGLSAAGDQLRDDIRRELLSGDLSAETLSEIYGLQQEATIAQRQYDTLLTRMRDLEAQALVQVADSRVVSQAIAPSGPSFPNTKMILALALVASLMLGVGLAFVSEYYVGGIHSAHQLANVIPARIGSVVPKASQSADQASVADIIIDAPMSQFSESLRRLRANIDRFAPSGVEGSRMVVVTSAIPAEGKSVTALALARTYSAAGKRTLLIDADMRKPTQNKLLGVTPASGLFEYLVQSGEEPHAADCYDVDPRSRVGVIFGRQRPDAPTDQPIQSEAFRRLIEDARHSFDVIVIDTPPLIPVVDARYVAAMADAVVLCVRTGETSQSDARTAYDQLVDHAAPTTAILTALTFQSASEHDYKYSGYYY